ncbi:glycosyltransferase family 4 protein [Moorena producens]|uniref:glycosyltransferase family 4 protein n=1 Tax=Moorena producens TaxID=1155739 RepID=UPI003C7740E1
MIKIAVDATPIRPRLSGIGMYALNLIQALHKLQGQEDFKLSVAYQPSVRKWLSRDWSFLEVLTRHLEIKNIEIKTIPLPVTISSLLATVPNPILPYCEQYLGNPDIVHGTDHVVYPCRKSLRVMTIHDLTFIKYPQYVNSIVKSYTARVKQCLRWTDLVITVSQSTKQDIVNYLRVNPDKIKVIPQASRYSTLDLPNTLNLPNTKVESLLKSVNYDFAQPYILFVSTLEPRKNINTLIAAFNYLKQRHQIEHQLVLIGQKGWSYESIFAAIASSPWKHHIHHLGYLSDQLVAWFYSNADVFVYPSYYEGFGLPVLEAMTLGAPVVTSNTSSLPEVAGDAAILIDPNQPIELADAIVKVTSNSSLREELIRKGKERAMLFSWERTARETLAAYTSLVGKGRGGRVLEGSSLIDD